MYSDQDTHRWVGCPIRISMDQRLLAAPHGFSQRATSFIASWCQGIHRTPFSCSQPREYEVRTPYPHLAQEPSNLSCETQDLSPSTGSHRTSSMGSLLCRPMQTSCENNRPAETDAPSSTSILFTPLNTSGCGDLVFTHLLRSDLQPARPGAPNPDSHVKRTKPAFLRRPATSARPSPGYLVRGSAQCSYDLLSLRDGVSPNGGGRYRTDDPLLAKQVLSH
jgi:hypothetical protein